MIKATLRLKPKSGERVKRVPKDPVMFEREPVVNEIIAWCDEALTVKWAQHEVQEGTDEAILVLIVE